MNVYAEDPLPWLASHGLWAGTRSYDDVAKEYVRTSGHYLELPPPGALMAVSLEPLTRGLFGDVPSGRIVGLSVLGRPAARNLPQQGTWAELTRFVLDQPFCTKCGVKVRTHTTECPRCSFDTVVGVLPEHVASHLLRVAAELWFRRPAAETIITYHDRTRHTGCIYKKAGFRKFGVTRRHAPRHLEFEAGTAASGRGGDRFEKTLAARRGHRSRWTRAPHITHNDPDHPY